MVTREIVYVWLSLLALTFQPSHGDVGNLLHSGKKALRGDFHSEFNNGTKEWIWNNEIGSYSICYNQQTMLATEELNTTNIKEVLLEVEFKIQFNNKSLISVVIIPGGENKVFNTTGYKRDKTGRLRASQFLKLNSQQTQFAFQASNESCFIIYSANITYNFCPKKTIDLAHFPRTNSPSRDSLVAKVEGICSNALSHRKPFAYCASNGSWSNSETIPCGCQVGLIKTSLGCIKLTYEIQDLEATRLSNNRAVLLWKAQEGVQYRIHCKKSPQCNIDCSRVEFTTLPNGSEAKQGTKRSNVSGLKQGRCYMFIVIATIKVFGLNNSVYIKAWNKSVMARELPGKVRNLSYRSQEPDCVVLSWSPPINFSAKNVSYKVICQIYCITPNCSQGCPNLQFIPTSDNLRKTTVTVKGFDNGDAEQYLFTIFTKDGFRDISEDQGRPEWNFNSINYTVETRVNITSGSKKFNVVDVIIGVSVLVLAVIVTIVATKCYNRWKARKDSVLIDTENRDQLFNCEDVPLNTRSNCHYVDPSNYENVKNLLRQFAKKLNEKNLKIYETIGEGEFGVVSKGYLGVPAQERVVVAVKSLRCGLSAKLRRDFLMEASVMGQFNDPNVISLYGVVVKKNIVKIVMEYMSNGSLDKYLVNNNGRLTTLQLLGMARGIASGMKYLSGRNFIHRDLAARNILVDSNLSCKVSDFGLSREICTTSNYETRGGKIPIRWTAPEVIKHKKSFIASDVWSFGVVLWEILSFGQRPYWDWDNFQVLQEIESGYRLPAPLKCPKTVHCLMLDCWDKERTKRPQFSYIVDRLDDWIRSPEKVTQSPALAKRKDGAVDVVSQSPIQQWLSSIKMGRYVSNFNEAGYCNVSQVAKLTEEDLKDMGITLVGHRHKIYQSIPLVARSENGKCQLVENV